MKKILLILFLSAVLLSCNKEQFHARNLYIGEGTWRIESIQYQKFDSTGRVTLDSAVTNMGELIFFKSESLSALYDYRMGVWLVTDTSGTHGNSFQYTFDGKRIHLDESGGSGFAGSIKPIQGLYTAEINKKGKQVWSYTSTAARSNAFTSLKTKVTMTLKKE